MDFHSFSLILKPCIRRSDKGERTMKDISIRYISVDDLKPYGKNPRLNKASVEKVANSIREFGFKVPMVIDKDNVIVTGHTRYEACLRLGIKTVPCIIADDLTPKQIKAFRLADNKVGEDSLWDEDMLADELDELVDELDMSEFGFDWDDDEDEPDDEEEESENERHRTDDAYNLREFDPKRCEGFYQMPTLHGCSVIPHDLIGFNFAKTSKEYSKGVHFYVDDYQFERIWNDPMTNIDRLRPFECVLTPDFSLYLDMPIAMQIWNIYRSRLIGQMMEREGLNVIPTVSWAEPSSYQFCFDGLPYGSILSVSTVGIKKDEESLRIYRDGIRELMKVKKPKTLLIYGGMVDAEYGDAELVEFSNKVVEKMKNGR